MAHTWDLLCTCYRESDFFPTAVEGFPHMSSGILLCQAFRHYLPVCAQCAHLKSALTEIRTRDHSIDLAKHNTDIGKGAVLSSPTDKGGGGVTSVSNEDGSMSMAIMRLQIRNLGRGTSDPIPPVAEVQTRASTSGYKSYQVRIQELPCLDTRATKSGYKSYKIRMRVNIYG